MRRLSVKVATLLLLASLAAPAMAAPRDDSPVGPIDRFERTISRFVHNVIHIFDLSNDITIPH